MPPSSDLLRRLEELEKQNELNARREEQFQRDLQATLQEVEQLKAQVKAGETREGKLIRPCQSRFNEIYWALERASPSLPGEIARDIARRIDSFEEFGREFLLYSVVVVVSNCSSLHIHWGSDSSTRFQSEFNGFHGLPPEEQEGLKEAVDNVIREQKRLFPVRSLVKKTCSKHLDDFVPEPSLVSELCVNASLAQIEELQEAFYVAIGKVFRELEDRKVDVERVLLDSWKPLTLIRPLAAFGALEKARARLEGEPEGAELGGDDEPAMGLFRRWAKRFRGAVFPKRDRTDEEED